MAESIKNPLDGYVKGWSPAKERERVAREAEERRRAAEEEKRRQDAAEAQAQKRREDARFACQLLYDRLTSDQRAHFPQSRFDAYLAEYLSDKHSAEYVQERARQLQSMINETFQAGTDRRFVFASLQEIAVHFQERRDEIEKLGYKTEIKDALLAMIAQAEQTAIRKFLSP